MEIRPALLIFGLSGLTGVLVDFDHFVALMWWQYVDQTLTEGRIFHPFLFIVAGIVILGMVSYLGRLHSKLVLRR